MKRLAWLLLAALASCSAAEAAPRFRKMPLFFLPQAVCATSGAIKIGCPAGGGGGGAAASITPGTTTFTTGTNCGAYADGSSILRCVDTEIAYDGTTLSAPKFSIANGTAGAPTLFLSSDAGSDTGFYSPGAPTVSLSINGNQTYQFGASGLAIFNSAALTFANTSYITQPSAGLIRIGEGTNVHALLTGRRVVANTGTATPALADSGTVYTNTGDADGSQVTLPNDPTVGVFFTITAVAAQNITVAPSAGETVMFGNTVCATSLVVGGAATGIGDSLTAMAATGGSGAVWITTASAGTPVCTP